MGNNCVGPKLANNGFLQSVTAAVGKPNQSQNLPLPNAGKGESNSENLVDSTKTDGSGNPPPHLMADVDTQKGPVEGLKQNSKPTHFRRTSSLGVQIESVLGRKTTGQFGTTYLCLGKSSGKQYACKSIAKRKLTTEEDIEDVRREIQIMHHLAGQPSVVQIFGAYEDADAVHAELARVIVGVVEACQSLGVMHRDLKPENFLFADQQEEAPLKAIDFELSVFFKPGEIFTDVVESPYYVAPEVLRKHYRRSKEYLNRF
ncbi:unnamed protein product [Withania somnifera]